MLLWIFVIKNRLSASQLLIYQKALLLVEVMVVEMLCWMQIVRGE